MRVWVNFNSSNLRYLLKDKKIFLNTWCTTEYRWFSPDAIIWFCLKLPHSKMSTYKTDELCKFWRSSICQIWDTTWNTRKYFQVCIKFSDGWTDGRRFNQFDTLFSTYCDRNCARVPVIMCPLIWNHVPTAWHVGCTYAYLVSYGQK